MSVLRLNSNEGPCAPQALLAELAALDPELLRRYPDPTAVETTASTDAIDKLDAQLLRARESGHDSTPATRVSERDRLEFPDAQFDPEMLADDTLDAQPPGAEPVPAQPLAATEPPSTPSFVQHAQRNARWNTPGMRALQGVVAVVLVAALGLQVAHRFRDLIAARWPGTGPALAAWCGSAGCTIDAPRRIEDVAVESTALARASSVPDDAFRLSVVLRNRGAMTVALPSVDLSLTDANGQLVSRRMLAPRDFGVASTSMRAGAEAALQLVLSTSGARVTGYTVEVFYP